MADSSRWALETLEEAIDWCKTREKSGITCTLDVLGEDIMTEEGVQASLNNYSDCIKQIREDGLKTTLSVKLTSLGVLFNKSKCLEYLERLFEESRKQQVDVEIDMEGTRLIDFTIDAAIGLSKKGYKVTLAIQAYLNRTIADIQKVLEHGIKIRLVKGAYKGDTDDFKEIQEMTKDIVKLLRENGERFSIGTHDPELVDWAKTECAGSEGITEFGFLKGLADKAKDSLVKQGWLVSEYVPFGANTRAYVMRRKKYLKGLEKNQRESLE